MKRILLIYSLCTLIFWGCDDERQPPIAPVIANLDVTDITVSSAICTFTIEPVGAAQKAGVIFGTEASLQSETTEISTTSVAGGNISITLTSLRIDTEYYYKAYISDKHNSYIYSEVGDFRTNPLIINISTEYIAASFQAGSYKFNVISNGSWAITSNQEWCTVQPTSGAGDREITVSVTENTTGTPRTATLTISGDNQSQQLKVEQDIVNTKLDVSASTINAPYSAGQHTFNITSNVEWTIASDQDWCTVQPESGNGDSEITVSITENTTEAQRTATLTITAENQSKQVTVEQDIDNTTLEVSVATINAPYTEGQHTFNIISNAEWTISSDQDWCTVQSTSGTGNREITVSVTENNTETPRTATLTITAGSRSKQVKVEQDIDNTSLNLSVSTINAPYTAGQHSFIITSNVAWTISSDQDWCNVQPAYGNGNSDITVFVTANSTGTPRTATLTVTAGNQYKHVTVEQEATSTSVFGNGITAAAGFEGNGTQIAPYQINNAQQLKKLVDDVNNGNNYSSRYFRLQTDIQVTADEWIPISDFRGNFDGDDHKISGTLKSDKYESFGFFGVIGGAARISNLRIDATIINEGNFTDEGLLIGQYVSVCTGAIVGSISLESNIVISDCRITGTVIGGNVSSGYGIIYTGGVVGYGHNIIIQECNVNATIAGSQGQGVSSSMTGGIIGMSSSNSSISNCWTSGEITGSGTNSITGGIAGTLSINAKIKDCTNHAIVMGGGTTSSLTGGIAGDSELDGEIINCTVSSSATITGGEGVNISGTGGITGRGGSITNCTNNATVSGKLDTGGLIGINTNGVIHTSLNTGNISGLFETGGLAGHNNGKVYSCCTNRGTVNGQTANDSNQIGSGMAVETCPDGHTKR